MSVTESTFRTALVGGFNRQDVMTYIALSAKTAQERIAKLEDDGRQTEESLSLFRTEATDTKSRLEGMEQDYQRTKGEYEEARWELNARTVELTTVKAQLEFLQDQASKLEQGAAAYADLKDRTATIEMEAHQRAHLIEQEAIEKAKKTRTSVEQILYKIQAGYTRLRGDVDATVAHASSELGRVDKTLEQVKTEFALHDQGLGELLKDYREVSSVQCPTPLPLEDK